MTRLRGWGSLFALALPLLLWFVWSQLSSETSRITIERYADWQSREMSSFTRELIYFYQKNKKVAGPQDVELPEVPQNSGIKSWALQPDTTVMINLDAVIQGRPVQLHLVPVVKSADGIYYECVSDAPKIQLRNLCYAEVLQSPADIPSQLSANEQVISNLPPIVSSTGDLLEPGTPVGGVLVVPADPSDLRHCGYQCVKPKKCSATRQLACSKRMSEGNKQWLAVAGSNIQVKGSSIATLTDANKICENALGSGFTILNAGGVSGVINLDGGYEYWVHDNHQKQNNCWSAN